jgi:diguanylate cyclase (GGDEF)-like protein
MTAAAMATASSGVKERAGGDGGGVGDPDRGCALADDFLPISVSFYRAPVFWAKVPEIPMNLVARQDRVLLGGLAVALVVMFAKPIRDLLDLARDVERSSGLALVPALIILTVVFVLHLRGRRQEAKGRAAAAELEALQSGTRASEMERLVTFGHALGRSLDRDAIRDVAAEHLPKLAATDDVWVLLRAGGRWQALGGAARESQPEVERARELVADRAFITQGSWESGAIAAEGHLCLPLTAGGHHVGVLGIPASAGPFTADRQHMLAMAGALLAISIRNAQLFHDVRENSLRDGLTGCFNRTHALAVIDMELRRARRSGLPVSLIMLDIDHFKRVNDRYGHLCGDAVLAAVGARLREGLRGSDLKCRYGGEEFLALLPETPLEGAKRVAETLCRELADMPITWKGETVSITASLGIAVAHSGEVDGPALIGRADAALYRAKNQGRNCVRLSMETAVA